MDWKTLTRDCDAVLRQVTGELRPALERTAAEMAKRLQAGGKVLACGNGGSAADAQHFAAELVNRFLRERRPYAGLALTTDTSVLTSIGNDYGFEQAFEKQVQGLGRPGDVLVAISTSGNADNICRAVLAAGKLDIHTIGLTGGSGGRLISLVDDVVSVSCTRAVPRIQEGHALIIHLWCEMLEEILG